MTNHVPLILIMVLCIAILLFLGGPILKYPFESWASILKSFVEIVAILTGGLWTYLLFIKNRLDYPYAKIEHKIYHWHIGKKRIYLTVLVMITNAGKVLVNLKEGTVYARQIRPLTDELKSLIEKSLPDDLRSGKVPELFVDKGRQISWREIGYKTCKWNNGEIAIEPGETEELQFDFVLDSHIETVEIITYFQDARKRKPQIGWKLTTLYDIKERSKSHE